jgi:murein DD-endopeptidase MepM/ murein hydrolase activator NlpD
MSKIELRLPLEQIIVTQPFNVNFVDFYQKYWNPPLQGHPGIDFGAYTNFEVYAANDGIVTEAKVNNPDGGKMVTIFNKENKYRTLYYHLNSWVVNTGNIVKAGDLIGYSDNTGRLTTGSHLHFELSNTDNNGNKIERDNGFGGCIDPAPYFKYTYNGQEIGNKDWKKSRCYHRYYRGRPKGGLVNEVRVAAELWKYLKYMPSNEQINACTYGGWDRETVRNDAMYPIYSQLKKDEYLSGEKYLNIFMT